MVKLDTLVEGGKGEELFPQEKKKYFLKKICDCRNFEPKKLQDKLNGLD